jgi:hypothetical protein
MSTLPALSCCAVPHQFKTLLETFDSNADKVITWSEFLAKFKDMTLTSILKTPRSVLFGFGFGVIYESSNTKNIPTYRPGSITARFSQC